MNTADLLEARNAATDCAWSAFHFKLLAASPKVLRLISEADHLRPFHNRPLFARYLRLLFGRLRRVLSRWESTPSDLLRSIESASAHRFEPIDVDGYTWPTAHSAAAYCVERLLNITRIVDPDGCAVDSALCRELLAEIRSVRLPDPTDLESRIVAESAAAGGQSSGQEIKNLPQNPDVLRLAKDIHRRFDPDDPAKSKRSIAIEFSGGDAKKADALLRQLQPSRHGWLLDLPADK